MYISTYIILLLPQELPFVFLKCWWVILSILFEKVFIQFNYWKTFLLGLDFKIDGFIVCGFFFFNFSAWKYLPLCSASFWWEVGYNSHLCSVLKDVFPPRTPDCFHQSQTFWEFLLNVLQYSLKFLIYKWWKSFSQMLWALRIVYSTIFQWFVPQPQVISTHIGQIISHLTPEGHLHADF